MTQSPLIKEMYRIVADLSEERRQSILNNPWQFFVNQPVYVFVPDWTFTQVLIRDVRIEIIGNGRGRKKTIQVFYKFNKKPKGRFESTYEISNESRLITPEMALIFYRSADAMTMKSRIDEAIKAIPY